jgi:hypothetical protein
MARINIESDLRIQPRFKALVRIVGDEDKAVGMLERFWRLAQRYWGQEMALVPERDFEIEGLEILLEVDLAERREGGIYARGSEQNFDWYLKKCRAGKLGVSARRQKQPIGQPIGQPIEQPNRSTLLVNPPTPTPTPALYSVGDEIKISPAEKPAKKKAAKKGAEENKGGGVFIKAYCDAYKARYGSSPIIVGKQAGLVQNLLKAIPLEKAVDLVRAYLAMDDSWFLTKHHDLETFQANLNKISSYLEQGPLKTKSRFKLITEADIADM